MAYILNLILPMKGHGTRNHSELSCRHATKPFLNKVDDTLPSIRMRGVDCMRKSNKIKHRTNKA